MCSLHAHAQKNPGYNISSVAALQGGFCLLLNIISSGDGTIYGTFCSSQNTRS